MFFKDNFQDEKSQQTAKKMKNYLACKENKISHTSKILFAIYLLKYKMFKERVILICKIHLIFKRSIRLVILSSD